MDLFCGCPRDAERGSCGDGVDGGDHGEEVLETVEMGGSCGDGGVEGVEEGGIEIAEGELRDDVREVEA